MPVNVNATSAASMVLIRCSDLSLNGLSTANDAKDAKGKTTAERRFSTANDANGANGTTDGNGGTASSTTKHTEDAEETADGNNRAISLALPFFSRLSRVS